MQSPLGRGSRAGHAGRVLAPAAALAVALSFGSGVGCSSSSSDPEVSSDQPSASPDGDVVTYPATSLGLTGMSVNGRVQPHGAPTDTYFEYGPTSAYGARTPTLPLGPKLAAHYEESFQAGLAGWRGGTGPDLKYVAASGATGRAFVRYTEPTGADYNHVDGIGEIHLPAYLYCGTLADDAPTVALGGGTPDFRDAKITRLVRGTDWKPSGSELIWWSQVGVYRGAPELQYANWAHTGFALTDFLFSGMWETASYTLWNDTTEWTYAGTNREINAQLQRNAYVYAPLNDVLEHLDTNIFAVLAYTSQTSPPTGSIDFGDIAIAYRNHSLLYPSNGGRLVGAPAGGPDNAAVLTDGFRTGAGRTWRSAPSPKAPLEIEYELERPVVVERVQLQQNVDYPSADVAVLASVDGVSWTTIVEDRLPASHPAGPIFAYLLAQGLTAPARRIKVRISSGYRDEAWGLGEIEVFGTGARMQTDDDVYRVNADISGGRPGDALHFRLVTVSDGVTRQGGDLVYVFPPEAKPQAKTGPASRMRNGTAKVEARINTLGKVGEVYFEYGADARYGLATDRRRAGPEITPRTVKATLVDLAPLATVHFRVVVETTDGKTYGEDATLVAQ